MGRVAVLKKTQDKSFCESEILIKELNLKILCIFVPYKRKLKRKDRDKLINILSKYDEVFTNEADFFEFETKLQPMNWMGYFLPETINYVIKTKEMKEIAVQSEEFSEFLKRVILELGERYRIVELYTKDMSKANDFTESIYDTVGLPVKINHNSEINRCKADYVIIINKDVNIYNSKSDVTYIDVVLQLLYPLNKYDELPIYKIIKSGLECGRYRDIIRKGMVKIVGEISK